MTPGFRKGEIVKVRGRHGKLPSGTAEVVGGCYGREDYVNVMFRGAGGQGRPRLGCVPVSKVAKGGGMGGPRGRTKRRRGRAMGDADMIMAPTSVAGGGVMDNPWLESGAHKKKGKKVWSPKKRKK